MQQWYYSPMRNAFYPAMRSLADAGPCDLIAVDEDTARRMSACPPLGHYRAPGAGGVPEWHEIPGFIPPAEPVLKGRPPPPKQQETTMSVIDHRPPDEPNEPAPTPTPGDAPPDDDKSAA